MSGNNNNAYAESKRLLLGIGDLYINDVFVGNLKGQVSVKFTRKYAYQRAGNSMADQKGEVTDEELMLDAEVCDVKLAQLRVAFGVNQAIAVASSRNMIHRQVMKFSGVVAVVPDHAIATGKFHLYSMDRKSTAVSGTDYKLSGGNVIRISGGIFATGQYGVAEYEWANASANALGFGGESLPPNTFQLDYVHTDSTGKNWQVRLFKAMSATAFAMAFHEAQKGTYTTHNVQFKALVDTTRPEGANLGEIIEESPLT